MKSESCVFLRYFLLITFDNRLENLICENADVLTVEKMRVMIVDDSPMFRAVMRDILVRVGVTDFLEAGNYTEAVELYRKRGADIVFMDMVLPGKSGVDVVSAIKKYDQSARIVAMSSMVNKKMIVEAINAGAIDFIIKPTNEIVVSNIIQVWGTL